MNVKHTLHITLSYLIEAFDSVSYEMPWFLDTQTGEVFFVTEDAREKLDGLLTDEETLDAVRTVIESSGLPDYEQFELMQTARADELWGESCIDIPPQDSREGYHDMELFIATVTTEPLHEKLAISIQGKGAFRRFKDVLTDYPDERERWVAFRDNRQRLRITEWLDDVGIQAELV